MQHIELSIASGDDTLSVRKFSVRERISGLFSIELTVLSPNDDIDFDAVVGQAARFRLNSGVAYVHKGSRTWDGVVRSMRQVQSESKGLSTYTLQIVPRLWFLSQRCDHRLFQHVSIPGIVDEILNTWRVPYSFRLDKAAYPRLSLRVQYGESDFAFLSRLLEEAGISYFFEAHEDGTTHMILADAPQSADLRAGGEVHYVDNPNQASELEYLSKIFVEKEVRPARYLVRDFDFRRRPDLRLVGEALSSTARSHEDLLEQYHYIPGALLVEEGKPENTPVADDKGIARHEERVGKAWAEKRLAAARSGRKSVSFETNAMDLSPGVVFGVTGHPRKDFGGGRRLMMTEFCLEGTPLEEWTLAGKAVFADLPYAPALETPKPRVYGVQSAVVVGLQGEEIHTDEFGRVRVQFHWDRQGKRDDGSSCWMRVSQGWAGSGFGMIAIPRVGQEVLVGFLEGDPDMPLVVGRLFNHTSAVPYKLPENKTVSGWRSDSTPGSDGFNEIRFEDAKGREVLYMQAERTLSKLVKLNEVEMTGDERVIEVGRKLTLTTGEASIVLDRGNIVIEGTGLVRMKSSGTDVVIEGTPDVKVNPGIEAVDIARVLLQELEDEEISVREPEDVGAAMLSEDQERYGKMIELKGSNEFRSLCKGALNELGQTQMGEVMLRRMAGSDRITRIEEAKVGSGGARAHSLKDAESLSNGRPGAGSDTTIYYNPRYEPEGVPSAIVLGKYMVHAYHNATGQRERGLVKGVKRADLQAVGLRSYERQGFNENSLRRQMGYEKRVWF